MSDAVLVQEEDAQIVRTRDDGSVCTRVLANRVERYYYRYTSRRVRYLPTYMYVPFMLLKSN